uniref:G_PROTEIN_RECEP_F1_2 domain-containing protein n=1 Tax=Steinernema glaseri TaxID=37863 RepID=A0A1I7Y4Z9_9BILA
MVPLLLILQQKPKPAKMVQGRRLCERERTPVLVWRNRVRTRDLWPDEHIKGAPGIFYQSVVALCVLTPLLNPLYLVISSTDNKP